MLHFLYIIQIFKYFLKKKVYISSFENIMENGTFASSKCFIFQNILKNLTFQRRLKALVWSKGLKAILSHNIVSGSDIT